MVAAGVSILRMVVRSATISMVTTMVNIGLQ